MTDEAARDSIRFRDPDTDVVFDTDVIVTVEHDDHTYALLTPTHTLVELYVVDEDGDGAAPIDEAGYKLIRNDVEKAVAEWGSKITSIGPFWQISPEPPDEVYDDAEIIDMKVDGEAEGDTETHVLLLEFDTGSTKYWLLESEAPLIWPVELDGDEARPLEDEELERIEPKFQAELATLAHELEAEDDEDDYEDDDDDDEEVIEHNNADGKTDA